MTHLTSRATALQDAAFQDTTTHRAGVWGRFTDGRAGGTETRVRWNIAGRQAPSAEHGPARG